MRVGGSIWHCKRIADDNAEVSHFELPYEIKTRLGYCTVQPANGASDLQEFGEDIKLYQTIIAQPYIKWDGVFKEGDRLYVEKIPTEEDLEDEFAENANYLVDNVRPQNMAVRVILKKRTAE